MALAFFPRKFTAADLLSIPDGDRYELADGELVELEISNESSWIAGEIYRRIANWVTDESRGWASPDNTGFHRFPWDEDRVRNPDASFVARLRLPEGPIAAGYCSVAPDLVVEVVSPYDLYYDVEQEVLEYLRAGVRMVWVVTPSTRTVMVHRSGDASRLHLTETAALSGSPVLGGFSCRVPDLFPPRPVASAC
jgi:Uma2 family endonuclease